jgi:hypothetical protein
MMAIATLHEPYEYLEKEHRERAPIELELTGAEQGTARFRNGKPRFQASANATHFKANGHSELFTLISDLMDQTPGNRLGINGNS